MSSLSRRDSKRTRTSESKDKARDDRRRYPAIDLRESRDAAILIATESSRQIMKRPKLNTGTLTESIADANSDINISDATILATAAIMKHLSNDKAAESVLGKSGTVTGYFTKLGLNDPATLRLFVTFIFTISPNISKALERTLIIALEKGSELNQAPEDDVRILKTFKMLSDDNTISSTEARSAIMSTVGFSSRINPTLRNLEGTRSEVTTIHPNESASIVGIPRGLRSESKSVRSERQLMDFIKNRRTSTGSAAKPEFYEVFPTAPKPVSDSIKVKRDSRGIGFERSTAPDPRSMLEELSVMSSPVDSARTGSHNVRFRERSSSEESSEGGFMTKSESVSGSVFNEVPDVRSSVEALPDPRVIPRALPSVDLSSDEGTAIPSVRNPRVVPVLKGQTSIDRLLLSLGVSI